jgi:hypothetical protein
MFKRFLIWFGWFFNKHDSLAIGLFFALVLVPFILVCAHTLPLPPSDRSVLLAGVIGISLFALGLLIYINYGDRKHNWRIAIDYAKKNFKENNRVQYLIPGTEATKDPIHINKLMDLFERIKAKRAELQSLTDKLASAFKEIDVLVKEVAELEEQLPE